MDKGEDYESGGGGAARTAENGGKAENTEK